MVVVYEFEPSDSVLAPERPGCVEGHQEAVCGTKPNPENGLYC